MCQLIRANFKSFFMTQQPYLAKASLPLRFRYHTQTHHTQ